MLIDRLFTAPDFDDSRLGEAVLADLGFAGSADSDNSASSFGSSGSSGSFGSGREGRFVTRVCHTAQGRLEITAPESWSLEATRAFADHFFMAAPRKRIPLEENTLPSWLWRKKAERGETRSESHVNEVFDRVTASACYKGWKRGLWRDESQAAAFYDEAHYLLSQRMIAFDVGDMRPLGLDWAYGIEAAGGAETADGIEVAAGGGAIAARSEVEGRARKQDLRLPLGNATIDGILGQEGTPEHVFWEKLLRDSREKSELAVRFTDTEKEWNAAPTTGKAPRGFLNLGAFLNSDGDVDVFKLRHATRLLTLLLELHYESLAGEALANEALANEALVGEALSAETLRDRSLGAAPTRDLEIGFTNMATLLMRLGLAYDSRTGRATAAALAAIISAEAAATSAALAGHFGPAPAFAANRDSTLRQFRNLRRAAYDEETDYERLSIVPQRLDIESGAHLVLIATARRRWDEAYELIQKHGVRHMRLTGCFASPALTAYLDALSTGYAPIMNLVTERALGDDEETATFHRVLHEDVLATLQTLRFDTADLEAAVAHATGYGTLKAAPGLCLADLQDRGFDSETLARVEGELSFARRLRHVFTPWILGFDFCRETLGLSAEQCEDPMLDILAHLGFTAEQIAQAEAFCFGHDTVCGMAELSPRAASIFLTASDLSAAAQMKMAASVQSFLMHDVALDLELPATASTETRAQTILSAWQFGLRSVSLTFQKDAIFPLETSLAAPVRPSVPTSPTVEARRNLLGKKKALPAPLPLSSPLAQAQAATAGASRPLARSGTGPLLGKNSRPKARLVDIAAPSGPVFKGPSKRSS